MANNFFQQMYEAFKRRTRLYKLDSGTWLELDKIVFMTTKAVTDANGRATVNLSGMQLIELLDVQLQAVCPSENPADTITCMLVGNPTTAEIKIRTMKPIVLALGGLGVGTAASTTVFVTLRGRKANS